MVAIIITSITMLTVTDLARIGMAVAAATGGRTAGGRRSHRQRGRTPWQGRRCLSSASSRR
jgi:hypothetical protein